MSDVAAWGSGWGAWFDYRLENHPEFLDRVAEARDDLRGGRGVRLEDVND